MTFLVWYASYGSNLLRERFLCYILGGGMEGMAQKYHGCLDKSLPKGDKQIMVPYELYFSKASSIWENGGVAFVKAEKTTKKRTLGRMYLITTEQFVQIVRQENAYLPDDENIKVDFEKTISNGESIIQANWYSRIVHLGNNAGHPILTFTSGWGDEDIVLNSPGEKYLKTIIRGLKEKYQLADDGIVEYLVNVKGIDGLIEEGKLIEFVKDIYLK